MGGTGEDGGGASVLAFVIKFLKNTNSFFMCAFMRLTRLFKEDCVASRKVNLKCVVNICSASAASKGFMNIE